MRPGAAASRSAPAAEGGRPTNAAIDLTFTAPKGLSVLSAVAEEPVRAEIHRAQEAGVRAALDYLERHECFVRRGANGIQVLPGQGFVAARYTHEMARSGDPHLHTHLVIANRVKGPDGRWTAPDMRPVYAAAKTAGTIAEAVTRGELTRSLGLEWEPVLNGTADVAAVPRTVREHFSARHAEILELAALRGYVSHAGIAALQPADGRAIFFVVEADREQLAGLAERVRDGRLRPLVGEVRPLAETADASPGARRTTGKTIIQVAPPEAA